MDAPSPGEQYAMWQALYLSLILNAADHEKLKRERGFSDKTLKIAGLRSSHIGNRDIIAKLAERFSPEHLAYVGIFFETDEGYAPSLIFCGWGATGEEVIDDRTKRKKRVRKSGVNPILIPYLSAAGECFMLRPHKDNIRRPDGIDELDEDYCGLHAYCAHLLRMVGMNPLYTEDHKSFCVITEGEFKALALIQAGIPALAVPGIQQIQNPVFRERLLQLLRDFSKTDVVICFDNECKDDPKFEKYYKPDEWKRVDTVVYARLTAQRLYQRGVPRTRIAYLPDDWRIAGKADWDSALKRFITEAGNMDKGTELARRQFLKVLKAARYDRDCRDLFSGTFQRLVEAKLVKLNHVRQCPIGGDEEMSLGRRIKRLQDAAAEESFALGQAFINTVGKHYERKPRRWKDDQLAAVQKSRDMARQDKNWLLLRYYEELLAGYPEPISNCAIRCKYRLITMDGTMHYLVTVHTVNREATEQHLPISGEQLCRPAELHNWLITYAKAAWMGGIKSTQRLVADIQADSAFREVHHVESYGHSEYCGLWKFADRAFTSDDKTILPDENYVFWYNGIGFATDLEVERLGLGYGFKAGPPILGELDIKEACESFLLLTEHLFAAIGDYDAWLSLGQILSYAAHPEIFRTYKGAPGLWFIGAKGSGKSTIGEWLIQIWGFPAKPFPSLTEGTTHNGVARELAKYGALPLPFDEFDALKTDPRVQSMLKNAFGRLSDLKAAFDSTRRTRSITPETTPFIFGENSSRDAATRSRYVNISILKERATGDRKKRLRVMNDAAAQFRHLGHFIMQNRTSFAGGVMDRIAEWISDPAIGKFITDQRQVFVSGAPFAAFTIAAELLQKVAPVEFAADFDNIVRQTVNFKTFAMQHGQESQKEVAEASFLSVWWEDVKTILQIGQNAHMRKFFYLKWAELNVTPQSRTILKVWEAPAEGLTPIMYMEPDTVYMIYAQELRKVDRQPRLSKRDLRAELRRESCWISPPENSSHRVTFPGHGRESGCWCFDLIEHSRGDDFQELLRQTADKNEL